MVLTVEKKQTVAELLSWIEARRAEIKARVPHMQAYHAHIDEMELRKLDSAEELIEAVAQCAYQEINLDDSIEWHIRNDKGLAESLKNAQAQAAKFQE